jgi:phosphopantothenoylcysteine decarboxylase/phosphopantothenate--cysteine ligase
MISGMIDILLGITGGIAAYKSATIVSSLRKQNFGVSVVMTEAATKLIAPATFEALTGRPVLDSLFHTGRSHAHIELAREAKVFCIAPATADIIGKAANGIADDLLSTLILSFDGSIILAPAMNPVMWNKSAVQRNVKQLRKDGFIFIGPEDGRMSCGETGTGRMAESDLIVKKIISQIGKDSAR